MCDALVVLADDHTLFAKSSDRPVGEVQLVEPFARRRGGGTIATQHLRLIDPGACAFVGARPTWLWGVEHGINEHGVAIGNERVWTTDDASTETPALLGMDLVRLGLEQARDAPDAVDRITNLLEEHGQGGIGEAATGDAYYSSFLVADPTEAWIVETSSRTWAAKPVDRGARGAALSNRLTLETEWTRASRDVPPGANFQRWRDQDHPTAHADQRLRVTTEAARHDPPLDPRALRSVLRDHRANDLGELDAPGGGGVPSALRPLPPARVRRDGTGVSVCMHLAGWEATTGSMIALLPAERERPLRAWAALGNPCVSVYVPIFPPLGVPSVLHDAALWRRFDRLRARVEAGRGEDPAVGDPAPFDTLRAIREVLDPVEDALWDDADAAADAAGEGPRDREGRSNSAGPVEAYLASVAPRLVAALDALDRDAAPH